MSRYIIGALSFIAVAAVAMGAQLMSGQFVATRVAQQNLAGEQSSLVRGEVASGPVKQKVFIGFKELPGAAERALVENHGGSVRHSYHIVNAIAAELPEPAIEALKKDKRVSVVEPDMEVTTLDAELDASWGVKTVNSGNVHDSGNKGTGVKIAVIDTGIDYNHPDLKDNYAGGYDFYYNDADPMDDRGHGTHVAGTIAARDNDAGVVGMAPEAQLYALKVFPTTGSASWSSIVAAIEWAVDNGIQVTNNSYGSSSHPGSIVQNAFTQAANAGLVMVASAGNSGSGTDTVGYPGKFDTTIAVAALSNATTRASYSSTGPAVELAAPGSGINSTLPGGGYGQYSGTSMAAPHVTGLAALAIRAGITGADAVRQAMTTTAIDLGAAGRDNEYGYGRIDAPATVAAVGSINFDPTVAITQPPNNAIYDSGASITFTGTANDTEDGNLASALVWTSSINGQFGSGSTVTTNSLSDGVHVITAAVTDSGGRSGSASITLTISSTVADTTAPTAPTGLLASEKTKGKNLSIDLSWGASTDNIAVTKYVIFRNSTQLAESTTTAYSDKSVQKNVSYTYVVRAMDAAGNISGESNSVTVTLVGDDGGDTGGGRPCEPWPSCRK
jgi:subtilisin